MSLAINIYNVGHGLAIHMLTPNGKTIVLDLGCSEDFSPLLLLQNRTTQIDSLIITHPHGDHIEDIKNRYKFDIIQLSRPKWLSKSDVEEANKGYDTEIDEYFILSDSYSQSVNQGSSVFDPENNGGVKILTFSTPDCGKSNINNHSIVTIIEYCGSKVVIPGDNESSSWSKLLENSEFVKAISGMSVFVASHHGRESGFCSDVFKNNKPKISIVSDGRKVDTDATSRYSSVSTGWSVYDPNGNKEIRKCLTTRNDGSIEVLIGSNNSGNFLQITKLEV